MRAAFLVALALAACGRDNGNASSAAGAAAGAQQAQADKFNLYTEAYNDLIEDVPWSLPNIHQEWRDFDLAAKKPSEAITYPESITKVENAVKKLREGRAARSSAEDAAADAAADRLIKGGEALLAEWRPLKAYFDSRGYREDGFGKARAAQPRVAAAYDEALGGLDAMKRALAVHERRTSEARREAFRRAGNRAGVAATSAMIQANDLLDAMQGKDFARADGLAAALLTTATDVGAEAGKLPATNRNASELQSLSRDLTDFVGTYRDYKQSQAPDDFNDAVKSFNDAVEQSNDLDWNER